MRDLHLQRLPLLALLLGSFAELACGGRAIRYESDEGGVTKATGGTSAGKTPASSGGAGKTDVATGGVHPGDVSSGGTSLGGTSLGGMSSVLCDGESFDHDADATTDCLEKSRCAPGSYVSDDGDATTDRKCTSCPPETFSATEDASECAPWEECAPDDVEATPGTSTSDRVCRSWTVQLGTTEMDSLHAVRVDKDGNIIVAGAVGGALPGQTYAGDQDSFVRKYDRSGNEVWTRQFGSSGLDSAYALRVDAFANIYVAGSTAGALSGQNSSGSSDVYLRKYDPQGNELWTRQFGSSALDVLRDATLDSAGHLYVCGTTNGSLTDAPNAGAADAFLRKYDSEGNVLDTQQFGTEGYDMCSALAMDPSDHLLMVGRTNSALPGQTQVGKSDFFLRRYAQTGAVLWTRQDGTIDYDEGNAVAVDGDGNVYVAGETSGELPGQTAQGSDSFLRKYDASGNVLWSKQFGIAARDWANDVNVDGSSRVFVVGARELGGVNGGQHGYVRKYDSEGALLWSQQIDAPDAQVATASTLDDAGYLYVVGITGSALPSQAHFGAQDAFLVKIAP